MPTWVMEKSVEGLQVCLDSSALRERRKKPPERRLQPGLAAPLAACQRFQLVHPTYELGTIGVTVLLGQQFAAGALQHRHQIL